MLTLSAAQVQAMGAARRDDFTRRLEDFLAPAAGIEPMPDVASRIEAARHLGLTAERDAAAFVAAGEVFGPRFHDRVPAAVRLLRADPATPGSAAGLRDMAVQAAAALDRAAPLDGAAPDPLARTDLAAALGAAPPVATLPAFEAVPAQAGTAAEGAEVAQRAVEKATEPAGTGGIQGIARRVAERIDDAIDDEVDKLTRPFQDLRDEAIEIRDTLLDLPAAAEQAVDAAKEKLRQAGRDAVVAVKKEAREAAGEIGDTAAAGAKVVRDAVKKAAQDLLAGHAMDLGAIRCAVEDLVHDVLAKVDEVVGGLAGRLLGAAFAPFDTLLSETLDRIHAIRAKLKVLVGAAGTLAEQVGRLFDNIRQSFDATDFSALLTPCPQQAEPKAPNAGPDSPKPGGAGMPTDPAAGLPGAGTTGPGGKPGTPPGKAGRGGASPATTRIATGRVSGPVLPAPPGSGVFGPVRPPLTPVARAACADIVTRIGGWNEATRRARLADDVYGRYHPDSQGYVPATPAGFTRLTDSLREMRKLFPGMTEAQMRQRFYDPDSTFRVAVYRETATGKLFVTFRGTENAEMFGDRSWLGDWGQNLTQGLGFESTHYAKAQQIGQELVQSQGRDNVVFVGHSLGGGMASAAAIATGSKATTFNPAGLHRNTVPGRDYAKAAGDINAYIVDGEVLDWVSKSKTAPDSVGNRITLPAAEDISALDRHGMDSVAAGLAQRCQADAATFRQMGCAATGANPTCVSFKGSP
jgi:hypothetical protein